MGDKIIFDYIKLPDYYTSLLRSDMQTTGRNFIRLKSIIFDHKPFLSVVSRCFKHVDPELRLERLINSLGWPGFRDRLAAQFIDYELTGVYRSDVNVGIINDILNFEEKLKNYTVDGFSRGFLLAFYLKIGFINSQKQGLFRQFSKSLINEDLIPLLNLANGRIVKVDIMILILHHFYYYLGVDNLKSHLNEKTPYDQIIQVLEEDQKKELVGNLLSYTSSIGEVDLFDSFSA